MKKRSAAAARAAGPGSRNPLHEGQHVPEDGEVDVVIVRHLLVDLLDALPDLFPRRIIGLEDPAAVEAESCPVGQQFTEGDGVDTRALDPVRGQKRPDPAVDAEMVPGQRLQDGNRREHLADAGDIHHDIRSHGEPRRVRGRAGKAGGNNLRLANERHVADDVSLELAIDAVRQPAERNARTGSTDPAGGGRRHRRPGCRRTPASGPPPQPQMHDAASAAAPSATTQIRLTHREPPAPRGLTGLRSQPALRREGGPVRPGIGEGTAAPALPS